MSKTDPIPAGYPHVNPNLCVDGAGDAIEFYTGVFGFTERMRMEGPPGKVAHCELQLGDSIVMVADEFPDMGFFAPPKYGGSPQSLMIYVPDVDAVHQAALDAGATSVREPENQFYGDRSATVKDPWGHSWTLATHVEDVSPEEMERRMAAWGGG